MRHKSTNRLAGDRIRATAAELFYQQGIRAVGVDELVERARATKPSLYRSFVSKDALATAYLRDFAAAFWGRFDAALNSHPGDPRAQLRELFARSAKRTRHSRYRGCALTNAAIEYPDKTHPAHRVAEGAKREVRRRLRLITRTLGVESPNLLADGLTLLFEGAYVSRQLFGRNGPERSLSRLAGQMIDRWPRSKRRRQSHRSRS